MATQLKYIEYNGLPVVSARDLYSFLTEGKGNDVAAWVVFCSGNDLMVEGEDYFKSLTKSGHNDILMAPMCAAVMCSSFKTILGKMAFNYIKTLNTHQDPLAEISEGENDDSSITIAQAAKIFNIKAGSQGLHKILRDAKVFLNTNLPYRTYITNGDFKVRTASCNKPDGTTQYFVRVYVMPSGLDRIKNVVKRCKELVTV